MGEAGAGAREHPVTINSAHHKRTDSSYIRIMRISLLAFVLAFAAGVAWGKLSMSRKRAAVAAARIRASNNDIRYLCQDNCGAISSNDVRYFCQDNCGAIGENDVRYLCQNNCGAIGDNDLRYFCQKNCGAISDNALRYFCQGNCGAI